MVRNRFFHPDVANPVERDRPIATRRKTAWRLAELLLLFTGTLLISIYTVAKFHSKLSSHLALYRFYHASAGELQKESSSPQSDAIDFTLWSEKRIQAYRASLLTKTDLPVAVLRIPRIHLEVPVFDGTDDVTLDRGVGRIIGTAKVGQPGNIGIAGHRDGFFRGLKDIVQSDVLELDFADRTIHYTVQDTRVVQPEDVSVLAGTKAPTLTLVTCFPFYFVGSAPQRFIVRAASSDFDAAAR